MTADLRHVLDSLGPLEARIMTAVWAGDIAGPFVVRDIHGRLPELAYTTVMTTLNRLAAKGLLQTIRVTGQRALQYRSAGSPSAYLQHASRRQAQQLRARFGDRALAAFAAELNELSAEELERLRRLADS